MVGIIHFHQITSFWNLKNRVQKYPKNRYSKNDLAGDPKIPKTAKNDPKKGPKNDPFLVHHFYPPLVITFGKSTTPEMAKSAKNEVKLSFFKNFIQNWKRLWKTLLQNDPNKASLAFFKDVQKKGPARAKFQWVLHRQKILSKMTLFS